jgi:hypothetical protein
LFCFVVTAIFGIDKKKEKKQSDKKSYPREENKNGKK